MIISVRGTHGSGKSTTVRTVMSHFPYKKEMHKGDRRRPMGYDLRHPQRDRPLVVVGHYESPSGGCDNIPAVEDMYSFVRENLDAGGEILMEGILAQHYALKKFLTFRDSKIVVLVLNTPLPQCILDTMGRRKQTTPERALKISETITREYKAVQSGAKRLVEAGIDVRVVDRASAVRVCLDLLGLKVGDGICADGVSPDESRDY